MNEQLRNQIILLIATVAIFVILFYETIAKINFMQVFVFLGILFIAFMIITYRQKHKSDYDNEEDYDGDGGVYEREENKVEKVVDELTESLKFGINNIVGNKVKKESDLIKVDNEPFEDRDLSPGAKIEIGKADMRRAEPGTSTKANYGLAYRAIESDIVELHLGKSVVVKRYNLPTKNNTEGNESILELIAEDGTITSFKIKSGATVIINKTDKSFGVSKREVKRKFKSLSFESEVD